MFPLNCTFSLILAYHITYSPQHFNSHRYRSIFLGTYIKILKQSILFSQLKFTKKLNLFWSLFFFIANYLSRWEWTIYSRMIHPRLHFPEHYIPFLLGMLCIKADKLISPSFVSHPKSLVHVISNALSKFLVVASSSQYYYYFSVKWHGSGDVASTGCS